MVRPSSQRSRGRAAPLATIGAAVVLSGCASFGVEREAHPDDPLEPINRVVFEVNEFADGLLLRPAAEFYSTITPPEVQTGVTNFLRNLRAPVLFANFVLQGDAKGAEDTFVRFLVNTTIGLAGFIDVATDLGHPYRSTDFGLTLGHWGLEEGAYLVLPLFGPSTIRDTAGMVGDGFADPWGYVLQANDLDTWIYVRAGVQAVDGRARILPVTEELRRSTVDYYSALRSSYLQQRRGVLRGNGMPDLEEFEDWEEWDTPQESRSPGPVDLVPAMPMSESSSARPASTLEAGPQ